MDSPQFVLPPAPVADYERHLTMRKVDALAVLGTIGADGGAQAVDAAGLRGRGGAWFPTARKWATTVDHASDTLPSTLVVNAAEGEPGSFKDRQLLRADPYSVLEGAVIAAQVIGADTVVVAAKERFVPELRRIRGAIEEMRERWSDQLPEFTVVEGPNRYLFGEESGLLEAVDGRPPFPRISPPWRQGAHDLDESGRPGATPLATPDRETVPAPALVQNVETLARVAQIVRDADDTADGPADRGSGSFLATFTGAIDRHAVVELPIGITLDEAIDAVGRPLGPPLAALNGVSHPIVPAAFFDRPLMPPGEGDHTIPIGPGAFRVFGWDADPVAIAAGAAGFLATESCGQCTPCKSDGLEIYDLLVQLSEDRAPADALDTIGTRAATVTDGARCGLAQQQADVVDALLAHFPDAVSGHSTNRRPGRGPVLVAPLRDLRDGRALIDNDHARVQPDWTTDEIWTGQYPATAVDVAAGSST